MSDPDGETRGGLVRKLRLPFGLALLALVFWLLPLGERLEWKPEDGESVFVPGEIQGDWREDVVRFAPDPDWEPGPVVPPILEDWSESPGPVPVARGPLADGSGSYGWHPAVLRVFRDIDPGWALAALALFFAGNCMVVTRWWRLLRAIGLATTWFGVFRLNFLGMFFNAVVPGLTGGDLVKAVIVARESPGRRTDAVVSVMVDRLIGVVALASIAAAVIFLVEGFEDLRLPVLLFLSIAIVGALVYTSRRLRRLVRFDAFIAKLPLGDKFKLLDDAVLLYKQHQAEVVVAVLISLANHMVYVTGVWLLGLACGVTLTEVPWQKYLVIMPIANIVTALPLTPGGLGVGEALYVWLFEKIGASPSLGVAVSLTFRLTQMLLGLLGGVFLLLPGARSEIRRAREEQEEALP